MSAAGLMLFLLIASAQGSAKPSDKQCLAYSVKREAENQPLRAQKGVLEVIKRRMHHKKASCREIVSEKHQFSWWHKNLKMEVEDSWLTRLDEMYKIAPVTPKCSQWFFSDDIKTPQWARKMRVSKKEGNMRFLCDVQH